MKFFGIKSMPSNLFLEPKLQTLSVATWILFVNFSYIWGSLVIVYFILYTEVLRYIALLYLLWMFYDRKTCYRGGRSEKIWSSAIRNNAFWRYFCNYFPIKLVKTVDINPNKSHLFVCIPHGTAGLGLMGSFVSDVLGCRELFSGLEIRLITLNQFFKNPIMRDLILLLGLCSSNGESINYLLSTPPKKPYTGKATCLIVGGAGETMESLPGTYRTLVNRRKGFVKLALKNGTSLVPVITFGETDLYNQLTYYPEGSTIRRIQEYIRSWIGISPTLFSGRGFFQNSFGVLPKRLPVTVVVGGSIELPKIAYPTSEQIDEYHEKFIKQLVQLFESQKHNYIQNPEQINLKLL